MKHHLSLIHALFVMGIALVIGTTPKAQQEVLLAELPFPVGLWVTVDDETNERKSIVEIKEENSLLVGNIVVLLQEPEGKCSKCKGNFRDKNIIGLKILWDFKYNKERNQWVDGRILDPKTDNEYKSYLALDSTGAQKLKVRGYVGFPIFGRTIGRTQTWFRPEPDDLQKMESLALKNAE